MYVPNRDSAIVTASKLLDYLLSVDHPDGRGKAAFFIKIGYQRENWAALAEDLKSHVVDNLVTTAVQSPYGTKYVVEGILDSPGGRTVLLRSIWIIEANDLARTPRLVTAYPVKVYLE